MGTDEGVWLHELFVTHAGTVRRFAARRVAADAVDDVVADVFAAAWRQGAAPEHAQGWLLRTAFHVISNRYRREARRLANERRAAARPSVAPDDAILTRVQVQDALTELSASDAEILRLAYWDDLTIGTIAQVLDCSESAAKVRLHRARRRLELVLGDPSPYPITLAAEESR